MTCSQRWVKPADFQHKSVSLNLLRIQQFLKHMHVSCPDYPAEGSPVSGLPHLRVPSTCRGHSWWPDQRQVPTTISLQQLETKHSPGQYCHCWAPLTSETCGLVMPLLPSSPQSQAPRPPGLMRNVDLYCPSSPGDLSLSSPRNT